MEIIEISRSGFFYLVLLIFSCHSLIFPSAAKDTLSSGQYITNSETIVSEGEVFELGFFSPGNSAIYYLGIWYKKVKQQTVVWVGNRDHSFFTSSAALTVSGDGNLVILDSKISYRVTNISVYKNVSATLLDTGNLVLRDENLNTLWQSFDFPSDTFLPGMKLGYDKSSGRNWSYVSWKSTEDPSPGNFTLVWDAETSSIVIMNGLQIYWKSGAWNGQIFNMTPEMRLNYLYNFRYVSDGEMTIVTYDLYDANIVSRFVVDISGQLKQLSWLESTKQWSLFWSQPSGQCDVYAFCGAFGICNNQFLPLCNCLPGFEPHSQEQWNRRDYSGGCTRRTDLQCGNNNNSKGLGDGFIMLPKVRSPESPMAVAVQGVDACRLSCLNNCSCIAYSYFDKNCTIWGKDLNLINMQKLSDTDASGIDFYLKLAGADLVTETDTNAEHRRTKRTLWIIIVPTISLTILSLSMLICRVQRNKSRKRGEDLLSFDFSIRLGATEHDETEAKKPRKDKKEVEIPVFNFSSVSAATNNFSSSNKLGEGGFGPVYMGKLSNGHKVAVKRLSRRSGQGWNELKNEAMLIVKLQHKNLVKLLGCCIEGDEKILIYEYLPNKSLDFFLFGSTKHPVLDWRTRVSIIEGIAQGLLYLHCFSRLQIIHRDLKASNILLDKGMNPKISDFGMARIFAGNDSQMTNRIVGTYGYMAPEYVMEGIFSVKSDVFSFGVLLLEILSGKKNTGCYQTNSLNLLGYAWDLWTSHRPLELMDPGLRDVSSDYEQLIYIQIGLLCVQECATDRPTMADVVLMLQNKERANQPSPKEPAFSNMRSVGNSDISLGSWEKCSVNEVTVSVLEAR
ncbi:hypothetical protein SLE2022_394770 [Rubroshorea leprosula]